jgi:lysophospholipase L1-like esterase
MQAKIPFLLLIALLSGFCKASQASECSDIDRLVATTPSPPSTVARWTTFQKKQSSPFKRVEIALIGDSLAEYWPAQIIEKAFRPVWNFGVGGDQTEQVLWRLSSDRLRETTPDRVLIVLGTNDLYNRQKPCGVIVGLRAVVDRVKELWPSTTVAFLEIPPRGRDFTELSAQRAEVNQAMRDSGIKTFSVNEAFTCSGRQPCENYQSDNLHFSVKGYEALTDLIRNWR